MSKWAALISAYAEMVARLKYTASPKVSCRDGAITARSKVIGKSKYKATYKSAGRRRTNLPVAAGCCCNHQGIGVARILPFFFLIITPFGQAKLRKYPGVRSNEQCI